MNRRFVVIVLDGFGIGAMEDTARVRPADVKANTLRSILKDFPDMKLENLEKLYTRRYGISLMEQGRFVRACGEAAFLDRERKRYACPACGGVVSLHDAQCSECGLGWKLPEC